MPYTPHMRAMLDTMVFDALEADPDGLLAVRAAVRQHRLLLLQKHQPPQQVINHQSTTCWL